jgi:hypothetical protein
LSAPDTEDPAGPFLEAVVAASVTASAMFGAIFWLDGAEAAAPPLPLLVLFVPIVAGLVIAVSAGFIGLPLTWLLARSGRERPWTYPVAGLIAGAGLLVGYFQIGMAGVWRPVGELLLIVALGGIPGSVCGLVWWRRYRRYLPVRSGE